MAAEQPPYPPPDALDRAVLVRNISPAATSAAIEDFFSFCGAIQSHQLRSVQPIGSSPKSQEAVVIFLDSRARADALVMDSSSIVDQPVSITPIPDQYDFNAIPAPPAEPQSFFSGGFSAFGDLFNGVGNAVAAEVDRAGKMIESATESGVLKTAKDQMALATKKTKDFATDIDEKWHVRDNIVTAAETSRQRATQVASVVAEQTISVAKQVDSSLHVSENTGKFVEKARENPTVNSGIQNIAGGFQQLLAQTGLGQDAGANSAPPSGDSQTAQQQPPPSDSPNH